MTPKNYYLYKRGKVWYAKFRDPRTGQLCGVESSGHTNKTLAERWAVEAYTAMEKRSGTSSMLLGAWAYKFYKEGCPHTATVYDKGRSIADSTTEQYRKYIDDLILPDPISELSLGEIRRADVMEIKDRIVAAKGRTRSAQIAFGVFRTVLREALHRGLLEADPSLGVPKVSYEKRPRKAIPMSAVIKILDIQNWRDLEIWRLVYTVAFTGMRVGEARGLLWQAVDNPPGRITVNNNRPGKAKKDKKPKHGKERIALYPRNVRELLEPLRQDSGYVFSTDGQILGYDAIANELDRACKRAEVRATMHQFRHSLNTYLRGQGVPDDLLRGAFGWSGEAVQEGYTHRELYDLAPIGKALEGLS